MRVWSGTQKKTGEKEIFLGVKMSKCREGDGMLWLAEHRNFRFSITYCFQFRFFKYVLAYMVPFVWPNLKCVGMVFQIALSEFLFSIISSSSKFIILCKILHFFFE